jgi:hypothetical protein
VVFAWGVYQFYRSTELGFRKPYWEKLLSLYVDACSSAATLARTDNPQEWAQARNVFWRMYYGPLCLVEDPQVEEAMVKFGEALDLLNFESPERKQLEGLSLQLAYACRDSIRADWRVPLEVLTGQK